VFCEELTLVRQKKPVAKNLQKSSHLFMAISEYLLCAKMSRVTRALRLPFFYRIASEYVNRAFARLSQRLEVVFETHFPPQKKIIEEIITKMRRKSLFRPDRKLNNSFLRIPCFLSMLTTILSFSLTGI